MLAVKIPSHIYPPFGVSFIIQLEALAIYKLLGKKKKSEESLQLKKPRDLPLVVFYVNNLNCICEFRSV